MVGSKVFSQSFSPFLDFPRHSSLVIPVVHARRIKQVPSVQRSKSPLRHWRLTEDSIGNDTYPTYPDVADGNRLQAELCKKNVAALGWEHRLQSGSTNWWLEHVWKTTEHLTLHSAILNDALFFFLWPRLLCGLENAIQRNAVEKGKTSRCPRCTVQEQCWQRMACPSGRLRRPNAPGIQCVVSRPHFTEMPGHIPFLLTFSQHVPQHFSAIHQVWPSEVREKGGALGSSGGSQSLRRPVGKLSRDGMILMILVVRIWTKQ